VLPRLLKFVDNLTNWYIRFNRKRLKGASGEDDASNALWTLGEILLSLSKLMAPVTPFFTGGQRFCLSSFCINGLIRWPAVFILATATATVLSCSQSGCSSACGPTSALRRRASGATRKC
jgi:hypothetical protein